MASLHQFHYTDAYFGGLTVQCTAYKSRAYTRGRYSAQRACSLKHRRNENGKRRAVTAGSHRFPQNVYVRCTPTNDAQKNRGGAVAAAATTTAYGRKSIAMQIKLVSIQNIKFYNFAFRN